ncbi:hypothetical protein BDR26DRAFT_564972 [Obelidium mucronatum]|nr:hypothetical protein BDR26DRAFT_564972 [Obelidium mucronatum]
MSSSSGTATFDPSLQKTMPSPQSMNQSPSAVTRTSNGLISTTTAAAASAGRIQGSTPLPTFTPTASSTTTTTTTASATRKYSTSHTHDHLTSPLPPNSLAWTDIIRTRYPNFQRSTVQTSKHAREFIETRKIPFYRVTPTHSLGRSKPTYAIPPALQKDFVEYFEEKFGALGVLGKKRVGGGQGGFDGSETASMCGEGGGAAANLQGPSYDNGGDAVAAEDGGVMMEDVEQQLEQQQFDGSKGKRKSPSSGASSSNGAVSANGIASSAGKKRLVKEEDSPVVVESMDGVAKSRGGRVVVSKGGLALIRYNTIVSKMMPDFKTLPTDARLAIKRGVKQFLQHEMGDDFSECLMKTPSDNGQVPKPTYGIPEHLVPGFQQWVYVELKKCFPERVVLSPPSEV